MARLFEAIVDANHRAARGENAGLHPDDFAESLPLVALTCIDPRLNPLMPAVLGIPEEQFIWLRNAGNIVTGPMSSTLRSLALACAVKGGREIAIIGHTDCRVKQLSTSALIERFSGLGVDRSKLPDNLNEFFGLFASERTNVIKAAEFARQSPLIGPRVPVHGLLVDIRSGLLEWVVNGYSSLAGPTLTASEEKWTFAPFEMGKMSFPEGKIGDVVTPPPPPPPASQPPVLKVKSLPRHPRR